MEAVGSASAIIGIATTGIQCSIKLLTFADQIKSAPDEITNIAEDISVNASILQQLGGLADEALFHTQAAPDTSTNNNISNGKARMVNPEATDYSDTKSHEPQNGIFNAAGIAIVMNLASKCNAIFERLEEGLRKASKQLRANPQSKDPIRLSPAEMVKWPFVKPQMDSMRAELRDAKGTLMLLLQVAMLRYSKKVMEGHTTRTSLIAYSEEDQYLLKRSIVAAERARVDIAKQRDDTLAGNRTASVAERDTVDENLQPAEMTTTAAISLQLRRPPSLENGASRGIPQISSIEVKNLDCQPHRDIDFCSAHTKPSDAGKALAADGDIWNTSRTYPVHEGSGCDLDSLYYSSVYNNRSSIASISSATDAPLGVYLLTPKLQIAHGKHHVEYRVRRVKVPRQDIDSQIDQWKKSPNSTVLNQLLALSADEQQALDALNLDGDHDNFTGTDAIEWIHVGEFLPVDGFDDIRTRSITFIVKLKHPSTTSKRRELKSEDLRDQQDIAMEFSVNRHSIFPESLNAFGLPWKWNVSDYNYMLVNKAMFNHFEGELLAHTRRLVDERSKMQRDSNRTELEVNGQKKYRRPGILLHIRRVLRTIDPRHNINAPNPSSNLILGTAAGAAVGEGTAAGGSIGVAGGLGGPGWHGVRLYGVGMEENVERTSQIQGSEEKNPAYPPEAVVTPATSVLQARESGFSCFHSVPLANSVETSPRASRSPSIISAVVESLPPMPSPIIHAVKPNEEEEDMEGIVGELLDRYTAA